MEKRQPHRFRIAVCMLAAFALWTAAVCLVDVQPIGPQASRVGFAAVNRFFHSLTGVHMSLYVLTDWLSLAPAGLMAGFALLGLAQWIQRKSIAKVDRSILVLGLFYALVLAAYLFFEQFAVNYRPVLMDGRLEASYPSSTTLLVLFVMPTAAMQLNRRIRSCVLRRRFTLAINIFSAFMVAGRFISGVHWFSDIIGGILLGCGLAMLYGAAAENPGL